VVDGLATQQSTDEIDPLAEAISTRCGGWPTIAEGLFIEPFAGTDAEEERPSIMTAAVAAAWATSIGDARRMIAVTPVPTSSCDVACDSAPSTVHTCAA
jgi:hypothetical protein